MWAAGLANIHLNVLHWDGQEVFDDRHAGSLLPALLLLALPGGPDPLGKGILRGPTLTWRRHGRGQSCGHVLSGQAVSLGSAAVACGQLNRDRSSGQAMPVRTVSSGVSPWPTGDMTEVVRGVGLRCVSQLCLIAERVGDDAVLAWPRNAQQMTIICSLRVDHCQTQSRGSGSAEIVICYHGKVLSSTAVPHSTGQVFGNAARACRQHDSSQRTVQAADLGKVWQPAGSMTGVRAEGVRQGGNSDYVLPVQAARWSLLHWKVPKAGLQL